VLSDVMMPRLDGFGLLKALRSDARTRLLPVILLSARSGEESTLEGLDAGADDYLVKPFSAKELLARVRSLLALAQLRRDWETKLSLANRELAEAAAAKGRFLATMSHEIRTPLNAVIGLAGLLADTQLNDEQREFANIIRVSGSHLLTIINDILDFSKIEAGSLTLEAIPYSVENLLEETLDMVATPAREKSLELAYELWPDVPSTVLGDPGRVRQILLNFLSNSVKFTERGEILASVSARQNSGQQRELVFAVRDTGIGLSPEQCSRLFQPFAQADHSTSRKYGGTGLGLVICKDLVEAMGGSLRVESHPGQGSRFWFSLPLERVDDAPGSSAAAETSAAAAEGAEGRVTAGRPIPSPALQRHVLLVEDNPVNQLVASSMLAALGASCEIAGNGLEGLEKLEQGTYDLVLMDVEMPQMDGHAATREIRLRERQRESRRVPVIAMTANAMAEDRERCIASGMDDYLAKPYEMDALAAIIRRWLPEAAD
jgi:signal transduction histidine kinase